jgi:hypothetical protein
LLVDNWYGAGGDLFCYYSLSGAACQWGTWGLIDHDLSKPNTPKYLQAVEITKTPRPPVRAGMPVTDTVGGSTPIDQCNYLGSNSKENMWCKKGDRKDYFIETTAAGTYKIVANQFIERPGQVELWVDGRPANAALPVTGSATLAAGSHCLWLIADGDAALGGGAKIVIARIK